VSYLFPSSTITFDAALRDIASGSPKARTFAAHALGDVTEPAARKRALDALIRALDDDRPEVRAEAASSLGGLEEPGALPYLIKRLDDGVAAVRQNAAIALGTMRAAEGFDALARALAEGPADLRFQAATSLAEIDPVRSFEHVLAALGDKDPQVVGAAALSVGAIASELGEPERCAVARSALNAQLAHGDPGARFDLAYALADLDDASGKAELSRAVTDEGRAWDAVTALGRLSAAPELAEAVANKRTPAEAATLAAGRLIALEPDHLAARKLLIDSLTSRKVHVRGIAIEQLTLVGGAWAMRPLEQLARSGKGADLIEPIANALRAIRERQ
jgi:HEAT repeat protein